MKVLIIGGGGREHALAWKVAQAEQVETVFVAPGNAGTAREAKLENVAVDVLDLPALADLAEREQVALTIVGPEAPLVAGVVDYFQERGLRCFGPSKAADEGLEVKGSVMASDAFFPSRDGIDAAAAAGITAVIQPGGSMRDQEVIDAANEHGIAMVFTGMRHFRH